MTDERDLIEAARRDELALADKLTAEIHGNVAKPFNLADLQEAMGKLAAVPLPPIFASSALFPPDRATSFKDDGRDYVLAHPDFWQRVPAQRYRGAAQPLGAVRIVDIDHPAEEKTRATVMAALLRAITAKAAPGPARSPYHMARPFVGPGGPTVRHDV